MTSPSFRDPPEIWRPFGPFSMAAVQGEGRVVHLKGQVALDRHGNVVAPGDMRAQIRQVLENIRAVLASFGGEMRDVLSLTHYVTDMRAFLDAGDVRRAFLAPPYPATTTVEVRSLYRPELVVEIAGIAEIPHARFRSAPGAGA